MNLKNLYQNEYSFEEKINENFFKLESFSTLSIKAKITSSTDNNIINDLLYLIDENDDELFKNKKNQVCCHNANIGWFFYTPKEGNIAYLQNESKFIYFDGEQWKDFNTNDGNNICTNTEGSIDLSQFLLKNQNLNDILNSQTARNNLNVYSKNEVYKKEEIDDKIQNLNVDIDAYTKSEIDAKLVNIQSGDANIDLSGYLSSANNLNDLNNKEIARENLSVYSKDEIDTKISNINSGDQNNNQDTYTKSEMDTKIANSFNEGLENVDKDEACHKIGTLRDWEIRRVGDYKMSAQKQDHDNWYICDGRELNRDEYPELFALIGTDFGAGNGTTTFNLPDFRNKTMWGANNNLNQTLESGLPNITGEMEQVLQSTTSLNGCFCVKNVCNLKKGGSTSSQNAIFLFDASKSNDIYGKSTIVQPPALCVNVFICVQ